MSIKKAGLEQSRNVTGYALWSRFVDAKENWRHILQKQNSKVRPLTGQMVALSLLAASPG
jgi:hypothetical protein